MASIPENHQGPITIVLGHSNPLVLSAMSQAIEQSGRFSLVAAVSTAEGFLATAVRVQSQIGIIEWSLPLLGGARLVEVLREQSQSIRIVVYGDGASEHPKLAMAAGAAAFAPVSGSVDDLLKTCVQVAEGKMVFPLLDIRDIKEGPLQTLTKREMVILETLSGGLTNREMSSELEISTNTLKFHLSNIYDKLSVKNRTQAMAVYFGARSAK